MRSQIPGTFKLKTDETIFKVMRINPQFTEGSGLVVSSQHSLGEEVREAEQWAHVLPHSRWAHGKEHITPTFCGDCPARWMVLVKTPEE